MSGPTGGLARAAGIVALLLAAAEARAQVAPYEVTVEPDAYVGLGPGAQALLPTLGDSGTAPLVLPFQVTLFGERFDTLFVNANGLVNVVSNRAGFNFPSFSIPSASLPNGFVAPLWADWCAATAGCPGPTNAGIGIFYEIDPSPGAGSVTIEWRRMRVFSDTMQPSDMTFSMTWYEGDASRIEMRYGPMAGGLDFAGRPTELGARIGLERADGAEGMWIGGCAGPTPCELADVLTLTDTRVTIVADAGEDVSVSAVSAPAVGYPGLPLAVSARLVNRHQNPLGPLSYAAFLLPASDTSTAGATPLVTAGPTTLSAFESRPISLSLEVPSDLPSGQYVVAVVVDSEDELAEVDEANNVGRTLGTVRLADRAPDFRVRAVRPLFSSAAPGVDVRVGYRLENRGNEPGPLTAQFVLSDNRAISTADIPLGPPLRFETASRQTVTGTLTAEVPASLRTGLYYVGAIVDPGLAVVELEEANNTGRSQDPIAIASRDVAFVTPSLPPAVLGRPYEARLDAAGGDGRYTYELTSGFPPRGLRFDEDTGVLSGVPLQAAVVSLTFRVTSVGRRDTETFELAVTEPDYPLTAVTRRLPDATLGQDYAVRLLAVGGAWPYGWSVDAGGLPPGVGLAPAGDVLGVPTRIGQFPVTMRVRDNAGATSTIAYSLRVRPTPNLTILSRDLPAAELGEGYLQSLAATGGIPPYTWRRVTTPPPGLVLSTDGELQGVGEQVGRFTFVVEVTDAVGSRDTNELVLDVEADGRFRVVTESLPFAVPGEAYRAVVRADGGEPPFTWEVVRGEGRPPGSIMVAPGDRTNDDETENDFVFSGTVQDEGLWAFTVRVLDARGRRAERALAIVARTPAPEPDVPADEGGCRCTTPATADRSALVTSAVLVLGAALWRRRRPRTRLRKNT